MAGPPTSAGWPSSTAPACSTTTAGSGSRRSATQLEPRLHLVPRFRQLLYRPRLGLGWPLWVDAPHFDLADHIRVHPVAAPAGETQLLQACQELARQRLDPARPLWELWLLPGLPDRRVGAYLRLHHALADGAAALAAFGALLDPTPDAPTPAAPPWTPAPIPATGQLLRRQPAPAPGEN